jgi:hypothetical protein
LYLIRKCGLTDTSNQDQDLQNGPLLKGRIALIERGIVSFQVKAVRAFAAGAIGIVFANDEDELYQPCIAVRMPE